MHVALIISAALVGTGALLYLHHRLVVPKDTDATSDTEPTDTDERPDDCCGLHIVCERDSLIVGLDDTIEYFDDDELDVYSGRNSTDYNPAEVNQFRDILLSLQPDDIAPWTRSISQRGIQLPDQLRDELILLIDEARTRLQSTHQA